MSFRRAQSQGFALAFGETLESRVLLSGVYTVSQITSLPNQAWEIGPSSITPFGNDVLFDATNPVTRRQAIWVSDGTRRGTMPLVTKVAGDKLLLGVCGSQISFAAFSTRLVFDPGSEEFDTPSTGEMYVTSDFGKTCTDLGPLPAGAGEGGSVAIGNELYFTTESALWVSDGTLVGTHQVTTLQYGIYVRLMALGDSILIEDGQSIDAVNLGSLSQQEIGSNVSGDAVLFNGKAYFRDDTAGTYVDGQFGPYDLCSTDGTAAGTVDVFASAANRASLPNVQSLGVVAGKLLLLGIPNRQGTSADSASEVYTCDGTAASITPIAVSGGDAYQPVEFDDHAVFVNYPSSGPASQLWETDGTAAGTEAVLKGLRALPVVAAGGTVFAATQDTYALAYITLWAPRIHTGPGQLFALRRSEAASSKLVVAIVRSNLGPSTAGSITPATVTVQITNTGDKTGGKGTTVTLLLSTDALGSQLAKIRTYRLNLALAPGDSRLITLPVARLPVVTAGEYFLVAQLATANGGFMQTAGADPMQIAAAFSIVGLTANNVQDAEGFDSGTVSFDLLNSSNIRRNETDTISIYASANQSIDGAISVGGQSLRVSSAPGRKQAVSIAIANPDWESALQYSVLIVQLTNNFGVVAQATVDVPATG